MNTEPLLFTLGNLHKLLGNNFCYCSAGLIDNVGNSMSRYAKLKGERMERLSSGQKHSASATLSAGEIASPMPMSSFLISGKTRETRWLKWSSSIRRYSMNELRSSVTSSRTILWKAHISWLLSIQPLTQTRRFLLLMRAFSSPSQSINAKLLKLLFC